MQEDNTKFTYKPFLLEAKLDKLMKTLIKFEQECKDYGDTYGALALRKAINSLKSEFNL